MTTMSSLIIGGDGIDPVLVKDADLALSELEKFIEFNCIVVLLKRCILTFEMFRCNNVPAQVSSRSIQCMKAYTMNNMYVIRTYVSTCVIYACTYNIFILPIDRYYLTYTTFPILYFPLTTTTFHYY